MKTKFVGHAVIPGVMLMLASTIQNPVLAQSSPLSVPTGTQRLLRANTTTEVASGKTLQIDGVLRVAGQSKATLKLQDRSSVQGIGTIDVESGSTLVIDSAQGTLGALKVNNKGNIIIKGQLAATKGLDFRSSGKVTLDGPVVGNSSDWKAEAKALYPNTGAKFTIENGGVLTGTGVLNGDLAVEKGGKVVLAAPKGTAAVSSSTFVKDSTGATAQRKTATPTASPDYLIVMGDISTSSGTVEIEITPTYYGQLSAAGTAVLGGSGLIVTLVGYTPAYAEAYRILRCTNITGQFGSFNATALNFDNRGIISIPDNLKAYRLSGY